MGQQLVEPVGMLDQPPIGEQLLVHEHGEQS
jgi:hypothetical protein